MTAIVAEVIKRLEQLPINLQSDVLEFVRSLDTKQPVGVPGKQLLQFAGFFESDDIHAMQLAISEGCEQVDLDEW